MKHGKLNDDIFYFINIVIKKHSLKIIKETYYFPINKQFLKINVYTMYIQNFDYYTLKLLKTLTKKNSNNFPYF